MPTRPVSYRFDDVVADLATFEIRKAGRCAPVERKAFEVLVYLIGGRGRVIDKSEILDAVWPDAFVSENALTRVIAQLRRTLGDSPREPKYIKTVQTRGYVFIADVSVEAAPDRVLVERPLETAGSRLIESLAVLPLDNLSGDSSQEYFADAMTDELITQLAKISALRVISRTSVMAYKRVRKPLPEIARELNVEAVVEGSALRSGNRVRVIAQLVLAETDSHLWAESYERELGDVLSLQSELARAIANEIRIKLTPSERAGLSINRPIDSLACEYYMKATYCFHQKRDKLPASKHSLKKSLEFFQQAIQIDPEYAPAHAGLARVSVARRLRDALALSQSQGNGLARHRA